MNNKQLTKEEIRAIDSYLTLLNRKQLPSRIGSSVQAIRDQYESTAYITPTQIALLRRCFLRARTSRYEVDWLPVGYLEGAIAHELDGSPCKMLCSSDVEQAISWLGIEGQATDELRAWHSELQDQLLVTGWLPADQLSELKRRYLCSMKEQTTTSTTMRAGASQ